MKAQRGEMIVYAVVALLLLGVLTFIGKKIYDAGGNAVRIEWEDAKRKLREQEQAKIAGAETEKQKGDDNAKIVYRKITQTVDRYIDRPVYRNVCFDVDGLRDANAALVGKIPDPAKPPGKLP